MANIEVNDINPFGTDLFADSESFLNELSNDEMDLRGGLFGNVTDVFTRAWSTASKGCGTVGPDEWSTWSEGCRNPQPKKPKFNDLVDFGGF
jgi:hypothetical protein